MVFSEAGHSQVIASVDSAKDDSFLLLFSQQDLHMPNTPFGVNIIIDDRNDLRQSLASMAAELGVKLGPGPTSQLLSPTEFAESLSEPVRKMEGQRGVRKQLESFYHRLKSVSYSLSETEALLYASVYKEYGWDSHADSVACRFRSDS